MIRLLLASLALCLLVPAAAPTGSSGPSSGVANALTLTPEQPTDQDVILIDTVATFSDSCHFLKKYDVTVNKKQRRVDLRMRYRTFGGSCLLALWDIREQVAVAPLAAGIWQLRVIYDLNGQKFFAEKRDLAVIEG